MIASRMKLQVTSNKKTLCVLCYCKKRLCYIKVESGLACSTSVMSQQSTKLHWLQSTTVIAEIFVRVKISYSSVRELSYATNFRTVRAVSHSLAYMHGFRLLLKFCTFSQKYEIYEIKSRMKVSAITVSCREIQSCYLKFRRASGPLWGDPALHTLDLTYPWWWKIDFKDWSAWASTGKFLMDGTIWWPELEMLNTIT